MTINIPPEHEAWLFGECPPGYVRLWSIGRWKPRAEEGDALLFRVGKHIVAEAEIYAIAPPGECNTVSYDGSRDLRGYKIFWDPQHFRDLRCDPVRLSLAKKREARCRAKRRIKRERAEIAEMIRPARLIAES